jgi:hypothetical protein
LFELCKSYIDEADNFPDKLKKCMIYLENVDLDDWNPQFGGGKKKYLQSFFQKLLKKKSFEYLDISLYKNVGYTYFFTKEYIDARETIKKEIFNGIEKNNHFEELNINTDKDVDIFKKLKGHDKLKITVNQEVIQ